MTTAPPLQAIGSPVTQASSRPLPPVTNPQLVRSDTFESQVFVDAPQTADDQIEQDAPRPQQLKSRSTSSTDTSTPPHGSVLTGKQEHYLKRELISQQTRWEVRELSHPTALQRFGAPFKSDVGEVSPQDSELPLLRYIFVNHVRNFPFLNQAKEKEFWQDKLQVFLESFANKHISSSEDRLETTKRAKLALKAEKVVELMMVSGIPTASGYEERVRFSEMEVVDSGPNEQGLVANIPQGHPINGWDVNVAGVRTVSIKRHLRHHKHAEFILRVKERDDPEVFVGRRFGDFVRMQRKLRLELPGKVLPPLPRKNKSHSTYHGGDTPSDDDDSISSVSLQESPTKASAEEHAHEHEGGSFRHYLSAWSAGTSSATRSSSRSQRSLSITRSARNSVDSARPGSRDEGLKLDTTTTNGTPKTLLREDQRVSLRAYLRNLLQVDAIAKSKAMKDFLTANTMQTNADDTRDMARRKVMDGQRLDEQRRFFEIARERARELDVHMEKFRRKVVEKNGLRDLFSEIKRKDKLADLDPEYKKFAEWMRIEVAATLYHVFLAEDNSPELFGQAKRIHSLVPYGALKQVIRFTNPAAVMASVLDIFMAQPLGTKSLLQRIFGLALGDGIRVIQRSIDALVAKIDEPVFCQKLRNYIDSDLDTKAAIHAEAHKEQTDILVKILQSYEIQPILSSDDVGRAFNAWVAWENAVSNVDEEMRHGAEMYAMLKQLLKLHTRQRDKKMMLEMVDEPNTLRLFRDLFTIFYEPLVRVYKSANVYNSVTDFARFADDAIATIEKAQRRDVSADPNQTVQAFIDLCERHEEDLYKFIHEVHTHDNGLFDKLMTWIEGILDFLRNGPEGGKLDVNALFQGAVDTNVINKDAAIGEINSLIKWQVARKRWHSDKTRQKMASGDAPGAGSSSSNPGGAGGFATTFTSQDFGLHPGDLQDLDIADDADDLNVDGDDDFDSEDDEADDADPIAAERQRRKRRQDILKRTAGEPVKPPVEELGKMTPQFLSMLRAVLAG